MSHKKFSSTRSLNCREDFVVNNGDGSNSAAAKTGASNNLLKRNSFGSAPVKRQHTIRGKILLPILSYVKCFFSLVLIFLDNWCSCFNIPYRLEQSELVLILVFTFDGSTIQELVLLSQLEMSFLLLPLISQEGVMDKSSLFNDAYSARTSDALPKTNTLSINIYN